MIGTCDCELLKGFTWKNIHKEDCRIMVIAAAIKQVELDTIERCANVAYKNCMLCTCQGEGEIEDCDIATAIRTLKDEATP